MRVQGACSDAINSAWKETIFCFSELIVPRYDWLSQRLGRYWFRSGMSFTGLGSGIVFRKA